MKRQIATLTVIAIAAFTLAYAGSAKAQDGDNRRFSINLFQTAPGTGSFLTLEGASVPPKVGYFLGMMADYQNSPLVMRECTRIEDDDCTEWGDSMARIVEHHVSMDVWAGLTLFRVFEMGLVVPVVLYQTGEDLMDNGNVVVAGPGAATGLDDIRLHLKLDLWHGVFRQESDVVGLALVPVITFPIGNLIYKDAYMGDSMVTIHPKLAFSVNTDRVSVGINVGYLWRESKHFYLADMGHRISFGSAVDVRFVKGFHGIVEVFGQNGFTAGTASSPLEADGALRYRFVSGLALTVGGGGGIIGAVGTPAYRVFLGLAFQPPVKKEVVALDTDKDGLNDDVDQCPQEPEDKDGYEDEDGCPDEDNDKDGIVDKSDQCPGDPEDKDGFEDEDGCPDKDNDKDGIVDKSDQCPGDPEDKDGFEDEDGCPDKDNDKDGIPDAIDQCPGEKEVFNGVDDDDGCPDKGKALVVVEEKQIKLQQKIQFKTDSDKIIKKISFKILDTVAGILKSNPGIKVRIEGHTDDTGPYEHNMDLSQRRAESVKNYLVEQGIEEERLEAVGFGPDKPIADNATKKGRSKNRRVEFHIVEE